MGAPVHVEGRPIGSLVVGTFRPSRKYSPAEQDALIALAEHVSLALNDARTVQAMHEALDQALHQAMHDALTGLPNRACFYERTEQALRSARRDDASIVRSEDPTDENQSPMRSMSAVFCWAR